MVEKNTKRFIKIIDYSSGYDSDSGGDYVNDTDDLASDKFNYRWNNNDNMLRSLQRNIEYIKHNLATQKIFSFMDYPGPYGANPNELPFQPMNLSGISLEFGINTSNSVILSKDLSTIVSPYGRFIDFIEPEDPGLTLSVGSSDLDYIQDNYGTGGVDTFYRVGHAGTESTPETVTYSSGAISSNNSIVYGKFYDHGLGVVGKPQNIRISSTVHGEFLEIVIDPTYANYRINASLWNGASLTSYSNVDSGVARSVGFHEFKIVVTHLSSVVTLDGSIAFNQPDIIETIELYEIESTNNTGSGDYFDVYPVHIFSVPFLTMTADSWNYIYYDYNTETFDVSTSWTKNDPDKVIVYIVYLPSGATGITLSDITDFRAPGRAIQGDVIYDLIKCNAIHLEGSYKIYQNTEGAAEALRVDYDSNEVDFMFEYDTSGYRQIKIFTFAGLEWLESNAVDYDNVILMNEIIMTSIVSIPGNNLTVTGGLITLNMSMGAGEIALNFTGENCVVDNVRFEPGGSFSATTTSRCITLNDFGVVKNCRFEFSGHSFTLFMNSDGQHNIKLLHNYFENTSLSVSIASDNIIIDGNEFITSSSGNDLSIASTCTNTKIINNTITNNIDCDGPNCLISNNKISGRITTAGTDTIIMGNDVYFIVVDPGGSGANISHNIVTTSISVDANHAIVSDNDVVDLLLQTTADYSNVSNNKVGDTLYVNSGYSHIINNIIAVDLEFQINSNNCLSDSNESVGLTVAGTDNVIKNYDNNVGYKIIKNSSNTGRTVEIYTDAGFAAYMSVIASYDFIILKNLITLLTNYSISANNITFTGRGFYYDFSVGSNMLLNCTGTRTKFLGIEVIAGASGILASAYAVIRLTGNYSSIIGCDFKGNVFNGSATIQIQASYITISSITIESSTGHGVFINAGAASNVISNITVFATSPNYGIHIIADRNVVTGCYLSGTDGVYCSGDNNVIVGNNCPTGITNAGTGNIVANNKTT